MSTIIPGAGGIIAGGVLAGVNDAYNQSIDSSNVGIDLGLSGKAALVGLVAGGIAYELQGAGKMILDLSGPIKVGVPFGDYGDIAGAIGVGVGSLLPSPKDCPNK